MVYLIIFIAFLVVFHLETEHLVSARLPKFSVLIRIMFNDNPYGEFKKIASVYRDTDYDHNKNVSLIKKKKPRHCNHGRSKKIGNKITFLYANRILEFRIRRNIRHCTDYEQLYVNAIALIKNNINDFGVTFVSSPLHSHRFGLKGGVKELRKVIIVRAAETHGNVFNQIPFLDIYLSCIKEKETKKKFDYFYKRIIESQHISTVIMNKGWRNSSGCRFEHEIALRSQKRIIYM